MHYRGPYKCNAQRRKGTNTSNKQINELTTVFHVVHSIDRYLTMIYKVTIDQKKHMIYTQHEPKFDIKLQSNIMHKWYSTKYKYSH
jgi:hypothetical protein